MSWNFHLIAVSARTWRVTPSRVCELKSGTGRHAERYRESHPHGCVSWNVRSSCRTIQLHKKSHPHGCVSWNYILPRKRLLPSLSHPHGCVSWNNAGKVAGAPTAVTPSRVCELKFQYWSNHIHTKHVTPSRVCELKYCRSALHSHQEQVTPSRVCELKFPLSKPLPLSDLCHTLTGVWVEIFTHYYNIVI